ncbi:MAG: histidinol dehydrogenase [Deltaproteobacteria bacterium]|nr:histidinol dehydrogenase [Deltaproteobacteria bacterium]
MPKRYSWRDLDENQRIAILRRPAITAGAATRDTVLPLIDLVRNQGDKSLRELTLRFDKVQIDNLVLSQSERDAAFIEVTPERRLAMVRAIENITRFHAAQRRPPLVVDTQPGVRCERIIRPIEKVGMYAPGGSAPLASTVLMLGVPARLAGCPTRVLCSPPRPDGSLDPHIIVAATLAGIETVIKVGGAQAIAAMAYGTESVPKVDKIFGPGNSWVTMAKMLVAEDPEGAVIDMPAGPSEVLVIADASADPTFVAIDMLSQAEHGPDSPAVLVTTSSEIADATQNELERLVTTLPRRDSAQASLQHSLIIIADDTLQAAMITNLYAPEHLIIQTVDARELVGHILNAGSVFLGPFTPESTGDYASGTNHVLPTYGYARAVSALSLEAFEKSFTVQELSANGLRDLAPIVETLAKIEGLEAHRAAMSLRREKLAAIKSDMKVPYSASKSTNWPLRLARATVRNLAPYSSARSTISHAPVLLDANENPRAPLGDYPELNRYPSPQPVELLSRLSEIYGVDNDNVVVGRGSDDVIDWLLRTFCEARYDGIIVCPPTYGVYSVFAELQGANVREVPLTSAPNFEIDVPALLNAWQPQDKLIFLCSPNNPTGNIINTEIIAGIAEAFHERALIILDEAYIEFADTPSMVSHISTLPNLVVLRTLSKAHGLAGARCGVGLANPEIISLLNKVRAPYPLPRPAIAAVLDATTQTSLVQAQEQIDIIKIERLRLHNYLSQLPITLNVFNSQANFLLARFIDAELVMAVARKAGIIIRDRSSQLGLDNCVRITIGTHEENDKLLNVLSKLGA